MNKEEWSNQLESVLKRLHIPYHNKENYVQAFTHPSYANEQNTIHYERLEFLGDAILGFLVAEYIYKNKTISEGEMTKLRANYVCTSANAKYCLECHLDSLLLLGKGAKEHNEATQAVFADVFESFLGAMYLDMGIDTVRAFLASYLFPKIKVAKTDFLGDFNSKLQEYVQAESRQTVVYQLIKEEGPPHDKTFYVQVIHDTIVLGNGIGKSRKEAEQNAARDALEKMVR
jgi:ribonuclease-3